MKDEKIEKSIMSWVDQNKKIKPTAIVLHWWQVPIWLGGIKLLKAGLKFKDLSVQYTILADGTIYQLTEEPNVFCHHVREANDSSIGIEIQGRGAKDLDSHEKQFESVVYLVTLLCKQFDIPIAFRVGNDKRFYGVTSHKIIDQYCDVKRIRPKRDVHDEYLYRVVSEVGKRLSSSSVKA